jgi:hypothetical protein
MTMGLVPRAAIDPLDLRLGHQVPQGGEAPFPYPSVRVC